MAPRRAAISSNAASQEIGTQPGSAEPFGVVRLSGWVRRRDEWASSGAARPLAQTARPVGWVGSGATLISRPFSTVLSVPQRERQSVQ